MHWLNFNENFIRQFLSGKKCKFQQKINRLEYLSKNKSNNFLTQHWPKISVSTESKCWDWNWGKQIIDSIFVLKNIPESILPCTNRQHRMVMEGIFRLFLSPAILGLNKTYNFLEECKDPTIVTDLIISGSPLSESIIG